MTAWPEEYFDPSETLASDDPWFLWAAKLIPNSSSADRQTVGKALRAAYFRGQGEVVSDER